jgi:hypothetical protein
MQRDIVKGGGRWTYPLVSGWVREGIIPSRPEMRPEIKPRVYMMNVSRNECKWKEIQEKLMC